MNKKFLIGSDLLEFGTREVRDLAWAIASAPMMARLPPFEIFDQDAAQHEFVRAHEWLKSLDNDPQALMQHLEQFPVHKLGYRFESLILFWLKWHPEFECLAHNLQVQAEKRTLGAFDFIVRTRNDWVEHWEVTVKFYLQFSKVGAWSSWIGPGKTDRLDLKLGRMIEHQLPLSETSAGISALDGLSAGGVQIRRAFIKGMLFRAWVDPSEGPPDINPQASMGVWIPKRELHRYVESTRPSRWMLRKKPDWLGSARCSFEESLDAGQLHALKIDRPEMLSCLSPRSQHELYEYGRIFIVPDDWARTD